MKFKLIPAGEFLMGNSESPEELAEAFPAMPPVWFRDECPQHKVRISRPFYLGVTEVTQEQYEKMMGKNPSIFSKMGIGADRVKGMDTSKFPVENVSWDDAVEFCRRLSAKEGVTYRLPTEAEWEYACRAGSTTRYCFGDDESQLGEYAWHGEVGGGTHPVGKKKPNDWGLYDMHGNVSEWCQDWLGHDYYGESPTHDPTGPATGSSRSVRGGCFVLEAGHCRSSARRGNPPTRRGPPLGFRVVQGPVSTKPNNQPSSDGR
jgi:formylglycine-generating enzyme required for sulfatase activity